MVHTPPTDHPFGSTPPLHILRGRLGWRVQISEVDWAEPVSLVMQAVPEFPGCAANLPAADIVWDLGALLASVIRPGAHQLLNCTCGYAPDAYLEGAVHVSHPDRDTVVWEMDVPGLRPALDPILASEPEGYLRWVFDRSDYEGSLRRLIRDLQDHARIGCLLGELPDDVWDIESLRGRLADDHRLPITTLQPTFADLRLERLMALDPDADWMPEPLCPAGTRIDIGVFPDGERDEFLRVDGRRDPGWMGRYFTRHEVDRRFREWVAYLDFAYDHKAKLPGVSPHRRVLRDEADRAPCHAAGCAFAETLSASLREGRTAPGVEVRYVERALFCAE
ncbi:MAG: hypothetical protein MUE46_01675 [Xanthomonadales bacterium]|jgi:hypothetical protein|nr:hypothetical protein [Xanthomonadales bacterium]